MRLVKLKLKNFRCYQEEIGILFDDLTTIIGKNDVGKSAILEALNAFFNDIVDKSDLSTPSEDDFIELTCYFEGIGDEVVLDTSVATSPEEEGVLNADGQLEIKKIFKFAARKSVSIFLVANHPSDERLSDLLSMKNAALKQYAGQLGVDLQDVNKSKNPPIRARIRNHIGGDREIRELKVDGNVGGEDNLKAIWSSVKNLLPIYSLFKSDKSFDDKDGDIKDPLQSAIDEALGLAEIRDLLDEVEKKVKEYSTDVADKTIEKLKNFDESISERLKSEFGKDPSYSKIFDLTLLNENNIPLNKRGSGIRRLVILSFFQAQAERRKLEKNAPSIIYAIEEPETSQHPNHQHMIIEALSDLSSQTDVQVMFSTHSANLVREIPIKSLRYISLDNEDKIKIEYGSDYEEENNNEVVINKIVKTLGILPNPSDTVKVLLYVEGNHDVNALKRYSQTLHSDDNEIINLMETNKVGYVITGGSALKHYIDEQHLQGLGKPEVHIYDNDVAEYRQAVEQINAEDNDQKIAFNTSKTELENYLHHAAIIEAYAEQGTHNLPLGSIEDDIDVPHEVARCFNEINNNNWDEMEEERKSEIASKKKKFLNTFAVEKMSLERIRERGGYDDLHTWFQAIKGYIS